MRVRKVLPRNPLPGTLDSFDRLNFFNFKTSSCTGPVQTIQPLRIPQVCGIRLALVASTLTMSDFANSVIGGLAFSAACAGLIIGPSLIVLAFVPRKKANRFVSVKLNMLSTALQFKAVVVACVPSRGTSAASWSTRAAHHKRLLKKRF